MDKKRPAWEAEKAAIEAKRRDVDARRAGEQRDPAAWDPTAAELSGTWEGLSDNGNAYEKALLDKLGHLKEEEVCMLAPPPPDRPDAGASATDRPNAGASALMCPRIVVRFVGRRRRGCAVKSSRRRLRVGLRSSSPRWWRVPRYASPPELEAVRAPLYRPPMVSASRVVAQAVDEMVQSAADAADAAEKDLLPWVREARGRLQAKLAALTGNGPVSDERCGAEQAQLLAFDEVEKPPKSQAFLALQEGVNCAVAAGATQRYGGSPSPSYFHW